MHIHFVRRGLLSTGSQVTTYSSLPPNPHYRDAHVFLPIRVCARFFSQLGGKSGISNIGNKLNAPSSNTGTRGVNSNTGGTATARNGAGGGLSGLVTGVKQAQEIQDLIAPGVEANAAALELEKNVLQATLDNVRLILENVSVA